MKILQAFEVFENKHQIYVVMELCSGGDLYRRLPYSEKAAAAIAGKVCSAIAFMHSKDVVHRDCKYYVAQGMFGPFLPA
jgi:serine/threonine protein kinase